jgi:hypothetical protein
MQLGKLMILSISMPQCYVCPLGWCPSSFKRKSDLDRHMITVHDPTKPYRCPHSGCEARFTRNDHLTEHGRNVHQTKPSPCRSLTVERFGPTDKVGFLVRQKGLVRRRGLSPSARKHASQVRKVGACIDCRARKKMVCFQ